MNDKILKQTVDNIRISKEFNDKKGMDRFHFVVQLKWQIVFNWYAMGLINRSQKGLCSLEKRLDDLLKDIGKLKKIRNLFAHQNGFIEANGKYYDATEKHMKDIKEYLFYGMHVFLNLLYIDDLGCKEVLGIAEESINIIKWVEKL